MPENALYAEARLGELLGAVERRGRKKSAPEGTFTSLPDGIDKRTSYRAQKLARNQDLIADAVEIRSDLVASW